MGTTTNSFIERLTSLTALSSVGLAVFSLCGGGCSSCSSTIGATSPDAGGRLTPSERCAAIEQSIAKSGLGAKVTVSCDEQFANIVSDTYPRHEVMTGIKGTNDQVPVPAPGYTSPIVLAPVVAQHPHGNTGSVRRLPDFAA